MANDNKFYPLDNFDGLLDEAGDPLREQLLSVPDAVHSLKEKFKSKGVQGLRVIGRGGEKHPHIVEVQDDNGLPYLLTGKKGEGAPDQNHEFLSSLYFGG